MSEKNIPRHVAIILDGNRRYAKKKGLPTLEGHRRGARKIADLMKWCKELGVRELTLYCFSTENFNRDKKEVDYLMNLFRKEFPKLKDRKDIHENKLRVNVIGRLSLFPKDIQEMFKEIMEKTKDYDQYTVNFALGYGGRSEIIDGVKKVVSLVGAGELNLDDIDEKSFEQFLYLKNDPEIVIRPGGEFRTSNFLTYQSTYSEWFFVKELWPEFTKENLIEILDKFANRERRFGR